MRKTALFVFNGEAMCFVHVLLNALDMNDKGDDVKIIIEGAAVKLVPELVKPGNPLAGLWQKVLDADLVAGVCKACASKLGTLDAAVEQKLTLLDDMAGHPAMSSYLDAGYEIISF
jgi:hypothetical protein